MQVPLYAVTTAADVPAVSSALTAAVNSLSFVQQLQAAGSRPSPPPPPHHPHTHPSHVVLSAFCDRLLTCLINSD